SRLRPATDTRPKFWETISPCSVILIPPCTVPGGSAVSARATGEPPPRPTVPPRPWNSVHDTPASAQARATSSCTRYRAHAEGKSEEHTSELQSLRHLVCRLLLEKKKKQS